MSDKMTSIVQSIARKKEYRNREALETRLHFISVVLVEVEKMAENLARFAKKKKAEPLPK